MPEPLDLASRRAKRKRILQDLVTAAEMEAGIRNRSMTCGQYDRHDGCAGAAHCLCTCHDPSEQP